MRRFLFGGLYERCASRVMPSYSASFGQLSKPLQTSRKEEEGRLWQAIKDDPTSEDLYVSLFEAMYHDRMAYGIHQTERLDELIELYRANFPKDKDEAPKNTPSC